MMKVLTSLRRQTGKTSKHQKMQEVFHTNSIFDELELVIEKKPQALEPHRNKTQIRTKKDGAKYAKV
jgi:hypothetical protein